MKPVIARVAIYEGQCSCCCAQTKPACVPEGCEPGSPFSLKTGAPALYLRFTQTTSYRRLVRLFRDLFGLALGAGPIDAMLGRAKPGFDAELAAVLAQLRKLRLVYSDETGVRLAGKGGGTGYSETRDCAPRHSPEPCPPGRRRGMARGRRSGRPNCSVRNTATPDFSLERDRRRPGPVQRRFRRR